MQQVRYSYTCGTYHFIKTIGQLLLSCNMQGYIWFFSQSKEVIAAQRQYVVCLQLYVSYYYVHMNRIYDGEINDYVLRILMLFYPNQYQEDVWMFTCTSVWMYGCVRVQNIVIFLCQYFSFQINSLVCCIRMLLDFYKLNNNLFMSCKYSQLL